MVNTHKQFGANTELLAMLCNNRSWMETLFQKAETSGVLKWNKTSQKTVIVMTFLVTYFRMDLYFLNFFFYFLSGLIMTPMFFMLTWLMFIPFPYVSFFTWSHGQEKSLSYYDLFNFGVLFYGCTPTLIFFYLLHNPTTPILPVYVNQQQPHLKKDPTRTRRVVIWKIMTVPRRTCLTPD